MISCLKIKHPEEKDAEHAPLLGNGTVWPLLLQGCVELPQRISLRSAGHISKTKIAGRSQPLSDSLGLRFEVHSEHTET